MSLCHSQLWLFPERSVEFKRLGWVLPFLGEDVPSLLAVLISQKQDQGRHSSLWQLSICKQPSPCMSADSWSCSVCCGQMRICGFPPWLLSPGFHSFYSEMELKFFQKGPWWSPRSQQGLQKEVKAGEGGQENRDQPKGYNTQSFIAHMWPDRWWTGSRKI